MKNTDKAMHFSNETLKNSLKCTAILVAVAVASVLILSIANALFPAYVPKLDLRTVNLLNQAAPSGVNDETALNDSYYIINTVFDVKAFNDKNGTTTDSLLAVYNAVKGDALGARIYEVRVKAYNEGLVMLIAFQGETLYGIAERSNAENPTNVSSNIFNPDKFEKLQEAVKNSQKTGLTGSEIMAITGSTALYSANGLEKAVKLAAFANSQLLQSSPSPQVVTDEALINTLKKLAPAAQGFTKYPVTENTVDAVYVSDNNITIYAGKGDIGNYGICIILITVDSSNAINGIAVQSHSVLVGAGYDATQYIDEQNLANWFIGKSLDNFSSVSMPTTGATQTPSGIKQAVKNALNYVPKFNKDLY